MTVSSRNLNEEPESVWSLERLSWARAAAAVLWLLAWWLTYVVIHAVVADPLLAGGIAFGIQVTCTKCESSLWRRWSVDSDGDWYKRPIAKIAWIAVFFDGLFNLSGAWTVVKILHTLLPMRVIAEITGWSMPPLIGWPGLGATIFLAVLPCALPELLWHLDD
jgi:hypothetical protein